MGVSAKISTPLGMLFACWAIVIVLVLMGVLLFVRRRREYVLPVVSLSLVPLVHIFSAVLANQLQKFLPLDAVSLRVMLDSLAAMIACLLLGVFSHAVSARRLRQALLIAGTLFLIVLTGVLVVSVFTPEPFTAG